MSCNIKRNEKKRYYLGDFRNEIILEMMDNIEQFNGEQKAVIVKSYIINAIMQDYNASETIQGDTIDNLNTHAFILMYVPEYEEIINNSRKWMIRYNNNYFKINSAISEAFDNLYLKIIASKRTTI
jgi:hypothetical protein